MALEKERENSINNRPITVISNVSSVDTKKLDIAINNE